MDRDAVVGSDCTGSIPPPGSIQHAAQQGNGRDERRCKELHLHGLPRRVSVAKMPTRDVQGLLQDGLHQHVTN